MMITTNRKEAKKRTAQSQYGNVRTDPSLHLSIRQQAKLHGMTTSGFVAWTFRTWIAADSDTRAKALQPTKS